MKVIVKVIICIGKRDEAINGYNNVLQLQLINEINFNDFIIINGC